MALQWETAQGGQKRLVKQCRQELGGLPLSETGDSQPYKKLPHGDPFINKIGQTPE